MKYVYCVGYGSYEESEFEYLCSNECLDKYQFRYIVHNAVNDVLKDIIEGIDTDTMIVNENGPSYQDIHDKVIIKLLEKYNFTKLNVHAEWSCFGWPSITDNNDWEKQRGDELNNLCNNIDEDIKHDINKMCVLKEMHWRKLYD